MSESDATYAQEARGCVFCSGFHDIVSGLLDYYQPCPRVKRIERAESGEILVLEFWPPGSWERRVVFPSELHEEATD